MHLTASRVDNGGKTTITGVTDPANATVTVTVGGVNALVSKGIDGHFSAQFDTPPANTVISVSNGQKDITPD